MPHAITLSFFKYVTDPREMCYESLMFFYSESTDLFVDRRQMLFNFG
jgi:hypothetical protein